MRDPDSSSQNSHRRRNFIVKKLREESQFKKRIHRDGKEVDRERKWRYNEQDLYDEDDNLS